MFRLSETLSYLKNIAVEATDLIKRIPNVYASNAIHVLLIDQIRIIIVAGEER